MTRNFRLSPRKAAFAFALGIAMALVMALPAGAQPNLGGGVHVNNKDIQFMIDLSKVGLEDEEAFRRLAEAYGQMDRLPVVLMKLSAAGEAYAQAPGQWKELLLGYGDFMPFHDDELAAIERRIKEIAGAAALLAESADD